MDFLFFWGPNNPQFQFSQWWKSNFTIAGKTFNCAEQFMMYAKAKVFPGNDKLIERIMAESKPSEHRRMGRAVKNYDDALWSDIRKGVVVTGNIAKFSQDSSLRELLKNTGNQILVEASPYDCVWGIGMKADDKNALDPNKWCGENNLGFAIMEARDMLFEN